METTHWLPGEAVIQCYELPTLNSGVTFQALIHTTSALILRLVSFFSVFLHPTFPLSLLQQSHSQVSLKNFKGFFNWAFPHEWVRLHLIKYQLRSQGSRLPSQMDSEALLISLIPSSDGVLLKPMSTPNDRQGSTSKALATYSESSSCCSLPWTR